MSQIFLTSDTHFCHDKQFLLNPRGFCNPDLMNERIIENWNNVVTNDDIVYHLGDVMLVNNDKGLECLSRLNGQIHLIIGNHDTDNRLKLFEQIPNIVDIQYGARLKYKGQSFFLSHFPCNTTNYDNKEEIKYRTVNLHGHTHQMFSINENDISKYHVGVDSHGLTPVTIDFVLNDLYSFIEQTKITK